MGQKGKDGVMVTCLSALEKHHKEMKQCSGQEGGICHRRPRLNHGNVRRGRSEQEVKEESESGSDRKNGNLSVLD